MKKMLLTLVAMTLLAAAPAYAQLGLSFGVKGGLNNTSMKFDEEAIKSKNRFGWFIGPALKLNLPLALGFDIAALYEQKRTEVNDETIKQSCLQVPLNVRLNLPLVAKTGVYLALGPQFGFNLGKDEFKWKDRESYENTFQLKKSMFSLNFGIGAYIAKHVELGFVYNIAMGKTGDLENYRYEKDDTKNRSWVVSACWYF